MSKLEAFHKYCGVQGILSLLMTGTLIYLTVQQLPVPDVVVGLLGTAWGFYFAKNGNRIVKEAKAKGK